MKKQIKEMLKGTYFDRNMSVGTACIFLIVSSAVITVIFSVGIYLFLSVISLIISFILSLLGL